MPFFHIYMKGLLYLGCRVIILNILETVGCRLVLCVWKTEFYDTTLWAHMYICDRLTLSLTSSKKEDEKRWRWKNWTDTRNSDALFVHDFLAFRVICILVIPLFPTRSLTHGLEKLLFGSTNPRLRS